MPDPTPTPSTSPSTIAIIVGIVAMILAKVFHVEIPLTLQQQTVDAAGRVVDLVPLIVSTITGIAVHFAARPKS